MTAVVAIKTDKDDVGVTVGAMARTPEVGDTVTVSLHDENGMPIEATGVVVEVLQEVE